MWSLQQMLYVVPMHFSTTFRFLSHRGAHKTNKLHGLSPRANYTDWATAAFADKGCHVVTMMDPYGCILDFLDRSRYFSIK
jgi:hypothetical protein